MWDRRWNDPWSKEGVKPQGKQMSWRVGYTGKNYLQGLGFHGTKLWQTLNTPLQGYKVLISALLWWCILHPHPLGCSMVSGIPVRNWPLCNELGGEVFLDCTGSSYMTKVGRRDSCCLAKVGSKSGVYQSSPDILGTFLPLIIAWIERYQCYWSFEKLLLVTGSAFDQDRNLLMTKTSQSYK